MNDDRTPTAIDRRRYLQLTGAAALGTTALAGCVGQAVGTLATRVTDQPADIGDFESLLITIDGFWLGPEGEEADDEDSEDDEDGEDDGDGGDDGSDDDGSDDDETDGNDTDEEDDPEGREYYEFDEPQEADLVELQDGETQLVDEREIPVGEYPFLQLDVSSADGTLTDGSEATVDLPGNAPLMFNVSFEVRENTRTTFTADFAPVRRGTGEYLLRPVPSGIEVTYDEDEESDDENESDGDE